MGGRRSGEGAQAEGAGWGGRRAGGRAGARAGRRLGAGHRRRGPRSSSWTAGSGSPPRTCRSWWSTSRLCSWRAAAVAAGVAAVVAGARGPGGWEEESALWGGHWCPQGLAAQPRLREPRWGASGLQGRDESLPGPGLPGLPVQGRIRPSSAWGGPEPGRVSPSGSHGHRDPRLLAPVQRRRACCPFPRAIFPEEQGVAVTVAAGARCQQLVPYLSQRIPPPPGISQGGACGTRSPVCPPPACPSC